MFAIACCLVVVLGLGLDLVSGCAHEVCYTFDCHYHTAIVVALTIATGVWKERQRGALDRGGQTLHVDSVSAHPIAQLQMFFFTFNKPDQRQKGSNVFATRSL